MRTKFFAGVAFAALIMPSAAYAQSTGSIDFEGTDEIVVTGTRSDNGVAGIVLPDTSKSKGVLNADYIQRQSPGASVNDLINQLPGVSFQNNDPYGSSGGSMNIRGFDASRISQTFDGVPLNDSGNYAIYSNQQLDPELIEQVNVNFGSTDVDSPTAAATGSTVNYRTITPTKDFGVKTVGSVGDFGFFRVFGLVNTGEFGPFGTRAFLSASHSMNNSPFNPRSRIDKTQYNARIWQPIGDNGDFISVAGNYNVNRNNFQGSVPLRTDLFTPSVSGTAPNQTIVYTTPRVVGPNSNNRFPTFNGERDYVVAPCTINTASGAGAQTANSCGSIFDERYNPSNTGNIRGSSRFTLADGLVLTVDPSFQYVKANGGGTVVGQEVKRDVNAVGGNANCNTTPNSATVDCEAGYWGGTPYFGRDLNGDGDTLDTVRLIAPSQTGTHRYGVIASLRYDLSDTQSFRVAYTLDHARHRQTGEVGYLQLNGKPFDVFPINGGLVDVNGRLLEKRDRVSLAILNQASAEYRGEFFDDKLKVNVGIRAPFFTRDLTNNCATSSAAGFVECGSAAGIAGFLAGTPTQTVVQSAAAASGATCNSATPPVCTFPTQGPQNRVFKYNRVLPNVGFTFEVAPHLDVYANYSKGLQVPGTDNLYNSFYFPAGAEKAQPKPETSDNFDSGIRYRTSTLQMQIGSWYTLYKNRLAASYDPDLDKSVYRNLGTVKKYGFDGTVTYQPIRELSMYAFGSYLHSEIQNDVEAFRTTAAGPLGPIGTIVYAPTAGKRESNAPVYTFGGGATAYVGPLSVGFNVKRTGPRYLYDTNEVVRQITTFTNFNGINGNTVTKNDIVYGNKAPAYTLVDLNARIDMSWAGLNKKTYFQLNVLNVFDTLWVGSINSGNGSLNQGPTYNAQGTITGYGSALNSQIGYPRTVMGSLVVAF